MSIHDHGTEDETNLTPERNARRDGVTNIVTWGRITDYTKAIPVLRNAIDWILRLEKHEEVNKAFPQTYLAITMERFKATQKHGKESINALAASDPRWLPILMEEVGEAAAELNYDAAGSLRAELVQVAAVACAWIDAIDKEQER